MVENTNIHALIFPLVYKRHMATWKKGYISQPPLQIGVTTGLSSNQVSRSVWTFGTHFSAQLLKGNRQPL